MQVNLLVIQEKELKNEMMMWLHYRSISNLTGEDIKNGTSAIGSEITDGAKDLVGKIDEELQNLIK
jgi:hypothetical protein